MTLKLMYITNRTDIARIAENAGIDRIFVDMEYIGKSIRQGGMDSVQNHHSIDDVRNIRCVIDKSELLVRVNPIHVSTADYVSSECEIDNVIKAGADIIMLPFFKTIDEVENFIDIIQGRTKTLLLLETPEAVEQIDKIVKISGIDEIHIGLNDLSLGYGKKFMFELLSDGTVERICSKINDSGIPYGFGGVSAIGTGMLPAELIIKEHYRLGSSMVILSRSFCRVTNDVNLDHISQIFDTGVRDIRSFEEDIASRNDYFEENKRLVKQYVNEIVAQMEKESLG